MAGILESKLVITAQDKTGAVIDALALKIEQLEKKIAAFDRASASADKVLGKGMQNAARGASDVVAKVDRLARSIESVGRHTSVLDRVAGAFRKIGSAAAETAKHMTGITAIGGGYGAGVIVHAAATAGRSLQDVEFEMKMAGLKPDEIARRRDEAMKLSAKTPQVDVAEIMHLQKEARSVLQHASEITEVMPNLVKAKAILDRLDPSGGASGNLGQLLKGAENIGAAQSPDRLNGLIDNYVKGMQVMGKTINPEQIFEFDKYSRSGGARLSDRFLVTTALSLSQEMQGSSAGKAVAQLYKQVSGGMQNLHTAAKEFARVGLIDPANLDRLKNGEVKGVKPGVRHAIKGDDKAATDPDKWVYEDVLPALEKAGITKQTDQLAWVQKAFPNSGVADLITKLIVQRGSYENHAKLYEAAQGTDAAKDLGETASGSLKGMTEQLNNLLAVASSPLLEQAAAGMRVMTAALTEAVAAATEHPNIAAAGLGATVVGAAGAGALLARSVLNLGLKMLGLGGVEGAAAGAGAAGPGLLSRLWPSARGASAVTLPLALSGDTDPRNARPGGISAFEANQIYNHATYGYGRETQPYRRAINLNPLGLDQDGMLAMQFGGDFEARRGRALSSLSPANIQVTGQADLTVTVSASPELIASVDRKISIGLRQVSGAGAGAGSTGRSFPNLSGNPRGPR